IEYVRAALARGQNVDDFAPQVSFFFVAQMNLFEEIAKFRAARRLWARIMKERFAAAHPKSMMLRYHVQTAGSSLTQQQPDNNIVRTAIEALAAVFGGAPSLATHFQGEGRSPPRAAAALPTLWTRHIISYKTRVATGDD